MSNEAKSVRLLTGDLSAPLRFGRDDDREGATVSEKTSRRTSLFGFFVAMTKERRKKWGIVFAFVTGDFSARSTALRLVETTMEEGLRFP